MCGLENSGGVLLPKICCPKAALAQKEPPHPFSSHPNIANVAGLAECGKPSTFKRIVGGEVGIPAVQSASGRGRPFSPISVVAVAQRKSENKRSFRTRISANFRGWPTSDTSSRARRTCSSSAAALSSATDTS